MEKLRFSDFCANCRKSLQDLETVYFVEKEIGRCFCQEDCIRGYFQPIVDYMREDLKRHQSDQDVSSEELELDEHKQLTLEDPDEIWIEQMESGERYFTFISSFDDDKQERFHYVVVCLTIDGIPSFVFLNFSTRDEDLIEQYRRGIELRSWAENSPESAAAEAALSASEIEQDLQSPLAEQLDRIMSEHRQTEDIPKDAFPKFEGCIEHALDDPDEIWTFTDSEKTTWYTFIARFSDEENEHNELPFAMIVVCQNLDGLSIVSAFPTTDPAFVHQFRKGINSLNKAFGIGGAGVHAA